LGLLIPFPSSFDLPIQINFSNFILQKDSMQKKFNQWLESLWFKPAGFFDNVQSANMQFVYVPFWMFDVKLQTSYRGTWQPPLATLFFMAWRAKSWEQNQHHPLTLTTGKVCHLVTTGNDTKAKNVESWKDAQGSRAAAYPQEMVCACLSVPERKLIEGFKTAWNLSRLHYGVGLNPPQAQQRQQQQPAPQREEVLFVLLVIYFICLTRFAA